MIDWLMFDKNGYAESTCHCRCGVNYRSHAKFVGDLGCCVSRKQCPSCGRIDQLFKIESDPEVWTLSK